MSASFRDHSMSLCMGMGFCRTPMSCGYYDTCEREGEAVAFVDKGLAAIGQPSTREQWALSLQAMREAETQSSTAIPSPQANGGERAPESINQPLGSGASAFQGGEG